MSADFIVVCSTQAADGCWKSRAMQLSEDAGIGSLWPTYGAIRRFRSSLYCFRSVHAAQEDDSVSFVFRLFNPFLISIIRPELS